MERYEFGSNTIIDDKASIESQYQKMEIDREIYLERARDSAELTIPYLVPEKGSNSATNYPTPYHLLHPPVHLYDHSQLCQYQYQTCPV